jgi:acetate kinase
VHSDKVGCVNVFVVNAGSSSLKLTLLDGNDVVVASVDLARPEPAELSDVLSDFLEAHREIDVAGHRVVHGGSRFTRPLLLDEAAESALEELEELAPLHNPPALAAIGALSRLRPKLRQVACFDTAFHADMPARASTYAVPREWRERWAIRRFGFHGLSHSWASRRAAEMLATPPERLRVVTAHIGAGASLAAVSAGRSVDTTMGFTPMEGLVMATRSGSVDPGLVLWLLRHGGLSVDQVEDALEHESGLRGLAVGSGSLHDVLEAMDAGDQDARLAYEVYVYRLQGGIAAMTAAMGGLDALVFTGGVGEGEPRLRADTCAGLGFLGVGALTDRNEEQGGDRLIAGPLPAVLVVAAREDIEIARHVRQLLT